MKYLKYFEANIDFDNEEWDEEEVNLIDEINDRMTKKKTYVVRVSEDKWNEFVDLMNDNNITWVRHLHEENCRKLEYTDFKDKECENSIFIYINNRRITFGYDSDNHYGFDYYMI